ncbi:hypothetical protein [Streptomyces sp. NPDC093149]|uniref:hypothetical protein n=1 Tax=Streptomyces sp. NPDC093149 TaxID=3366031 RepID=UPI00382483A9
MRASPPSGAHATDEEALARIDPLWRSWAGAHGGHVAAAALTARVVQDAPAEHASVSAATTPPQETL